MQPDGACVVYLLMRAKLIIPMLLAAAPVLAELEVEGVAGELAHNVRAYVELGEETCDAEAWRIRRRFRDAESQARNALEPFGYYEPAITSELTFDDKCWHARLNIDPGEPVLLRSVDVSIAGDGSNDAAFRRLLQTQTPAAGKPLRHAEYNALKEAMQVTAIDRGYIEAGFEEARIDVFPDERTADIALKYASGPRYNVGEIRQEQAFLEPSLVAAYLDLEPGVPYDGQAVAKAYRDLANSGYFNRIEVKPDYGAADNLQIPIDVLLEPAERIEYTIGAGFATDSGPRLRAGYRNQRMNERGHRLNIELRVSPVISGLAAEYRIPLRNPRSDWMTYTAAIDREKTDTFDSETVRAGVRRSRQLSRGWLRTLSVDINYDRFTVAEVDDTSLLVLPALSFDRKKADRDLYPSRGYRLGGSIRGTDEYLGSSTGFLQLIGQARWIRQLGEKGRVLARAHIGFTTKDAFTELPPSVRFFAGGDDSVRGFGYQTLGPKDDEGNVIGGSNLLVASIEYERQLRGNYYGALFVDAGNAYDDTDVDPAIGAGIGFKWRSPVGPVRLYLAHPLNKVDRSVRVHISIGAEL